MKYGESTFDILYLVFAVSFGVIMLRDAKSSAQKDMGLAALILGLGDAFHLVPRVMDHFSDDLWLVASGHHHFLPERVDLCSLGIVGSG